MFVAMHDFNLVHMLGPLGYYSDEDDSSVWKHVQGVDFNSSIRFEVFEEALYSESDIDAQPATYVRVLFDDLVLPCDSTDATICPLASFVESLV